MSQLVLSAVIAEKLGVSKGKGKEIQKAVINAITEISENQKLIIPNFGTFESKEKAAREGRNPKTGETVQIEAKKVLSFKSKVKY